jgi:hypothetical protein
MAIVKVIHQNDSVALTPTVKPTTYSTSGANTIIKLDKNFIVRVDVRPDQVEIVERIGNDAVITLKNGEKITLQGYFDNAAGQLLFYDGESLWTARIAETVPNQGLIELDYVPTKALNHLAIEESGSSWGLWGVVGGLAGLGTVAALAGGGGGGGSGGSGGTVIDNNPPDAATDGAFAADGKSITGKAEANSTVTVRDSAGNILGTAKVDAQGAFTVNLNKTLINGETVIVSVKDAAGNISQDAPLTAKDTVAPAVAKDGNFAADGKAVSGKAEPNSTVTIKDSQGTILGTASTDAQGNFKVVLDKAFTNGESVTVTVKDRAGNESTAVTVKAHENSPAH